MNAARARVAAMYRHTALVTAIHEAIATLEAPFNESDEMPGDIEDAIRILRAALGAGT